MIKKILAFLYFLVGPIIPAADVTGSTLPYMLGSTGSDPGLQTLPAEPLPTFSVMDPSFDLSSVIPKAIRYLEDLVKTGIDESTLFEISNRFPFGEGNTGKDLKREIYDMILALNKLRESYHESDDYEVMRKIIYLKNIIENYSSIPKIQKSVDILLNGCTILDKSTGKPELVLEFWPEGPWVMRDELKNPRLYGNCFPEIGKRCCESFVTKKPSFGPICISYRLVEPSSTSFRVEKPKRIENKPYNLLVKSEKKDKD